MWRYLKFLHNVWGFGRNLCRFGGTFPRNWQVLFEKVWQCFLASVVVCWHLMFPGDIWGVSGRSLRGVWGYLSGIHRNWRRLNMFGGYTGSQSLQCGVKTLFWHSLEWYGFLSTDHTETSKYQNRRI